MIVAGITSRMSTQSQLTFSLGALWDKDICLHYLYNADFHSWRWALWRIPERQVVRQRIGACADQKRPPKPAPRPKSSSRI